MKRFVIVLLLNLGLFGSLTTMARGESPSSMPEELQEAIAGMEEAANNQDLEALLKYYSSDFTNTDGLNVNRLAQALKQMWRDYPRLTYTTEVESWSEEAGKLVVETETKVKGLQRTAGRKSHLESTIRARQYFQGSKLVQQDILAEQSRLTSGDNPPQVAVVAPEVVAPGAKYNFDLIVDEPLGEQVLLGAIKDQPTTSDLYLNPADLELEPLPAGGIYKVATAALLPENTWISAILIRGDGITMITHRVKVKEKTLD